ncbi:tyrosine-type recombinase/integrase [Enterococcus sp. DIV0800]|uniref:tyrosine-type recombinase/integrase n=1 Tax=unclassified Enterococcus TaxID=2608891 RepID=UPI003D2FD7D5
MSRRGENIYKRKDGRWEGRYPIGNKIDGKIRYRSIYGKTYQEVKIKLYPLKIESASKMLSKGKCATPFYKWAFYWLDSIKGDIKPSTYASYRYKLEHYIFPYIGEIALNQLEYDTLRSLVEEWKKKYKPSSIHVYFQLLKGCLAAAVKKSLVTLNPCREIILPKRKKSKIHALKKQEQKKLENAARTVSGQKGLPLLISLQAGLRIGEIAGLKWENIDFDNKTITVEQTYQRISIFKKRDKKTSLVYQEAKTEASKRVVPMTNELFLKLKEKRKNSQYEFVFTSGSRPCEPRLLTYHFQNIVKKAGLFSIHFHQLRHTFATRCLEKNHDIASISRLLGHASTRMTLDVYTDSLMEQRKAVIHSLNK